LQSKSHEQAARELGYPLGSMSRHLSRARELLRERLLRRGLLAALAASALAEQASASVSPALLHGTLDTVRRHALAAALLAGATPSTAVLLAQGVLRTAWLARVMLATMLLAIGAVVAGGVTALQTQPAKQPMPEAKMPEASRTEAQLHLDLYDDPLPEGMFTPDERAIIAFARASAMLEPISDEIWAGLREHFDIEQCIGLVHIVGVHQLTTRFHQRVRTDLDQHTSAEIEGGIESGEDRGVLIATHALEQARRWDRVLCLNRRPTAFGPPAETLTREVLEQTYGAEIVPLPTAAGETAVVLPPHHHDHA